MPTNVYFNNFDYKPEQNLYEDLIIEAIQIYGQNVKYIPRTLNNFDELYTEDTISSYDNAYDIEMYVKSVDGFTGDGIFLSKYGLEIRDEVIFTVAKRRFEKSITSRESTRNVPKEGDVIYFPLNKKLFQIKYVDYKPFFYQHGKLQTYDLVCELFEYSGEDFNTGNTEIDEIQTKFDTDVYEDAIVGENGEYLLTENGDVLLQGEYSIATQDPGSDNEYIQGETDDVLDWSEFDPWSQGQYNIDTLNRIGLTERNLFEISKRGINKWERLDLSISGGIENIIDIT